MILARQCCGIRIDTPVNCRKQFRCCGNRFLLPTHLLCRPFCKYKAFQQRITCQTVFSVYSVTCRLSHSIQTFHGRMAFVIYPYPTHEIMLCRYHRNAFFGYIIPHFTAMFHNIREMFHQFFSWNGTQIFPYMICSIFCHLLINFFCQQITRQQLIDKPFHILVIKLCPFSADRFRNQKTAFLFVRRIECGRMNLYIIHIFQTDSMFDGKCKGISGQMTEIGRMTI